MGAILTPDTPTFRVSEPYLEILSISQVFMGIEENVTGTDFYESSVTAVS
jgi:hypothetical protein